MRAIVIYATCEGQTHKIAQHIAQTMSDHGVPTDTFDVTKQPVDQLNIEAYQAVVIGSSLHYGEHDADIAWCIREHREFLSEIPSAFFSVSLGIVSKFREDRKEAAWLAGEFLRQESFEPKRRVFFAGALRYSKYGWFKRRLMHWIAEKTGKHTQMNQDYEYTDWDAVVAFATDFAEFVHSCKRSRPAEQISMGTHKPRREYAVRRKTPS